MLRIYNDYVACDKKNPRQSKGSMYGVLLLLFLFVVFFVPAFKFINSTCRVNQFHFTGKERV